MIQSNSPPNDAVQINNAVQINHPLQVIEEDDDNDEPVGKLSMFKMFAAASTSSEIHNEWILPKDYNVWDQ